MSEAALHARGLRCERLVDPLGVQSARPVFSWIPVASGRGEVQTAYRVRVASDPSVLSGGEPDLWDSGQVESPDVTGIAYAGRALESRMRCWWTVELWDRDGRASGPSSPAEFEMGLLSPDDWSAQWIADAAPGTSPLLRREFEVPGEVRSARAYVTGLGYYELRLNGEKVGDRVLDPVQTNYEQATDLPGPEGNPLRLRSARVAYAVYDVTDRIRAGGNAVGLVISGGWYAPEPDHQTVRSWGDRPRGIVQIEIETTAGERIVVTSDESWSVSAGPIAYASAVHGERYDARLEEDGWDRTGFAGEWGPVAIVPAPEATLTTVMIEPIRVIETLAPVSDTELRDGVRILDFGQHISGWTRIRVSGPAGGEVTLRHAGELDDAGELDASANASEFFQPARQTDTYVLGDDGSVEWEPRFTLHGFRYVEVTTTPGVRVDAAEARIVHSDVGMDSEFASSDELLNRIDRNVRWTFRESLQGYPQDAADRAERVGWLGDPGWIIEDYLYQFDTIAFWAKWLDDIRDLQLPDGSLPIIAPANWAPYITSWGSDASVAWPDWGATYPVIAWHVYRFSGDRTILKRHYDGMRETLAWFAGLAEDGIVTAGLGDHMEPQPDGICTTAPERTPAALTSTAWLYRVAEIVAETAGILGDSDTESSARALADSVRQAFTARFFDPATGRYTTGTQTALALPLWFGMVADADRERVVAELVAQIVDRDDTHLWTGTMGTAAVEQVLGTVGLAGLMYDLATQTGFPSWGDQIEQGATTVWEAWGRYQVDRRPGGATLTLPTSLSMKLLAAVSVFLYRDVAGLAPAAPGWARMTVRPALTGRLTSARARVATVRGPAAIAWTRGPGELSVQLEVPSTTRAEMWLPIEGFADPVVREGETLVWAGGASAPHPDVHAPRIHDGCLRLELGGGTYRFTVTAGRRTDP